jgi:hypothetical protein
MLGVIAAFASYLQLARTRAVNSDGASNALQAWDMLHGNLLLHGWSLSDVSFYTTELPQYMLVEFLRGLNQDVVHVAAAMTYTLAILLAALLAKGTATGRQALVRALIAAGIMLAPQLVSGVNILLSSPDHIGTSVAVMVAWLILDHARSRWYVPVIAGVFLGWAVVADMLVLYIGILPLVAVCAIRIYWAVAIDHKPLASQRYDMALGAAALAGTAAAILALHVIRAQGGFYMPVPAAHFAGGTALIRNLGITGQGLLLLGGADFLGLRPAAGTVPTILHLAGVSLAAWGTGLAAWRFLRDRDLVAQLGQPPADAQNQRLTSWLLARHLHSGLSGYWESNVVTLTSGDRVQIREVVPSGARLAPGTRESKAQWYDPGQSTANFIVLFPGVAGYPGFTQQRAVLTTFGQPERTYHVGSYTVLVWNRNLLRELP